MIQVADNFNLRVRKPLDNRLVSARLANLVALNDYELYDGIIAYAQDRKSWYTWSSDNTVDKTYGKWRPFNTTGVQNAVINDNGELVLTFDGGIEHNVGKVKGDKGDTGDPFSIKKTYTRDTESDIEWGFNEVSTDYTAKRITDGNIVVLQSNTLRDGSVGIVSNLYLVNNTTVETEAVDVNADLYNEFKCNLNKLQFLFAFSDVTTLKGDTGEKGDKGDKGDPGETPAVSTEAVEADDTHPGGGTLVHFDYLDTNLNQEFTVWNGKAGKDGDTPTFTVKDIAATDEHPNGGQEIEITLGSDVLDSVKLYHGETSVYNLTPIVPDAVHAAGGTKVEILTGADKQEYNVYNGVDGITTEIELDDITPSNAHPAGGKKMTITTGEVTKELEIYNGLTSVVKVDDIAPDDVHKAGGSKLTVTTGEDVQEVDVYNGFTPVFTITPVIDDPDHPAGGSLISIDNGTDTPTEFNIWDGNNVSLEVEAAEATAEHREGGLKLTLTVNDGEPQIFNVWNGNTPTITIAAVADTDADAASYPNGGYRVTFNKDTDNEKEYVVTHGITPVFDITDIPSTLPNPQDPSSEIINAEYPNGGYNVKITVGSEVKEYNLKHGHTPVMTIESITDEDGNEQQNWFVDGVDTGVRAYGSISLNSNPETTEEIVTNVDVGATPAGTTFANKTTLTQLAKKILIADVLPDLDITLPYGKMQELGTSQAETLITARVKNINNINVEVTSLVFYVDNEIIEEKTWDGTTTTYTSNNADPTNNTTNYKVGIKYKDRDGNAQEKIIDNIVKFVYPTYVGVLANIPAAESDVTALSKLLIDGVESVQTYNTNNQMMVYATTGTLSSIISTETGFHLDWDVVTMNINSVEYHVYHSIPCGVSNFEVTFA